ncbi:MAG: methyltransferase domain-containing protein [Deltaproteobacteria bacterium]|nr:methyltransferase domain-containing protein [Deltaproteobacteria bacterium]
MRVVDLDRDHSSVFPVGMDPDSEFLYDRMREATYDALRVKPGQRVVDSAAGLGSDGQNLAERGLLVTNVEPSSTMSELTGMVAERQKWKDWGSQVTCARAWSEAMPFRDGAFDAAFCKGSIDHFDDPAAAIAEMARVTRPGGRVVVAVANFESLGCRWLHFRDRLRGPRVAATRKHYHVPSDHFTRFDLPLIREQLERYVEIEEVTGVSAFWGMPRWAALLKRLPAPFARLLLRGADALARFRPGLADIIVLAGRPR